MNWCCDCKNKYTKCDNCTNMSNHEKGNAIVELLKVIKTEIQKEADYLKQQKDYGRAYGMEIAIEYIDEHIEDIKEINSENNN